MKLLNSSASIALTAALTLAGAFPAAADDKMTDAIKETADASYESRVEMAKQQYEAAKDRCDPLQGNDEDVCNKAAEADYEAAKAQAKADHTARDASADANEETREADYALAKEKCDVLDGDAEDACVAQAKLRYGQ